MIDFVVNWLTLTFMEEGVMRIEPVIGVFLGVSAIILVLMFLHEKYKKPFRIAEVTNYWRDENGNECHEQLYYPEKLYFGIFFPWFIRQKIFAFNGLATLDGFISEGNCERWIEQHWAKKRKSKTRHQALDLI